MAKSPSSFDNLLEDISGHGLVCFGGLQLTENECAAGCEGLAGSNALLIGNAGAEMWQIFAQSSEFYDGKQDPMNRWTKKVLDEVAQSLGIRVVYPFDEPYWPFQKLARKAAGIQNSPLGVLIHPKFGLWHAFRGLLIFDDDHEFMNQIKELIANVEILNHPCDSCAVQPCLSACPVSAFTGEGLDIHSCFSYLDGKSGSQCMMHGCQARRACPIGSEYQQDGAQLQFHMKSYRGL